jgi:methylmalonyl-CoA mutase cobalamin-binding domain/chain
MLDVPVFLGGIIPNDDWQTMRDAGVAGIFGPGTSTDEIARAIREHVLGEA